MNSDIRKIYRDHKSSRFPYDTDGKAGKCSAHGKGERAACSGDGKHDVLLVEQDRTHVHWAACEAWTQTNPDAVAHLRRFGFADD